MQFWQILLFPFSLVYQAITDFRNHLYNIGYKKSFRFEVPIINVGNLTVGGTGKTPHVEYLIRFLKTQFQIATLSRGYGRKSKGFVLAEESVDYQLIGDEPMQFYWKFKNEITVSVGEERALAIPQILFEKPDTNLIILDDAYQHRAVNPYLNLLITDYNRLFFKDFTFPAGRLRESPYGAKRADAVIVSKCPNNLTESQQLDIQTLIKKYILKDTPIFFTGIRYSEPQSVFSQNKLTDFSLMQNIVLFSGIAQPQILENHLKNESKLAKHFVFPDHYAYQAQDLQKILTYYQKLPEPNKILLTTEKDAVKLMQKELRQVLDNQEVYYLPIEIYFLNRENEFQNFIFENLQKFTESE
jgi:tetraacyldisaccharide 4'-kinase